MALPYLRNFSLEGKLALITGAARGIGLEIARAMAGSGAHVILNGRDAGALNVSVQELREHGGTASALPFDIADADALKSAFAEIAAHHGKLDILVSNAGLRDRKLLQDFSKLMMALLALNAIKLLPICHRRWWCNQIRWYLMKHVPFLKNL